MKLIIAGSRSFCCTIKGHDANPNKDCYGCDLLRNKVWRVLQDYTDFHPTEIVSGAARGADKIGELAAYRAAVPVKQFPAKWRIGGKVNMAAGFERNQLMAEYADAALVMWDGHSKGSMDMTRRMKKAGKPCVVYNFVTGKVE